MPNIYFVADTHFSSEPLRKYEKRPFRDTEEMDRALIANWNAVVSPEDMVWHLGDFGAEGHEADILSKLNGKVLLVRGNHDIQSNDYYRKSGFDEVYDYPVLFRNFWLLSHEPVYVNTNMPYANIFGHVHASPVYKDFSPQHYCVCVERTEYSPVSFDAIKAATGAFNDDVGEARRKQYEQEKEDIEMRCLYASPEMMRRQRSDSAGLSYPFTQAVFDVDDEIGIDSDTTAQFCKRCGKAIPLIFRYCGYCGFDLREGGDLPVQDAPMGCVYASPSVMRSLKGLFKKGRR